ncbi:S-layer homology domain-containing protein [Nostoc sp. FACHB-87]|uniref:S-layer homology domain-containing protein n=1 Tax=Nostocaceae TaxID=1162 RepID=UPI0016865E09|nr:MULTISPECIES: S-layer homology domain-containing protein [Nostocaceae]MBD2458329.1 S-layer homology domain-containing protein [Nostoc sp. FACHB-87]MBD2479360.1 S-layer homology domain-containing protein [Anabaena sp. FACHB-83]
MPDYQKPTTSSISLKPNGKVEQPTQADSKSTTISSNTPAIGDNSQNPLNIQDKQIKTSSKLVEHSDVLNDDVALTQNPIEKAPISVNVSTVVETAQQQAELAISQTQAAQQKAEIILNQTQSVQLQAELVLSQIQVTQQKVESSLIETQTIQEQAKTTLNLAQFIQQKIEITDPVTEKLLQQAKELQLNPSDKLPLPYYPPIEIKQSYYFFKNHKSIFIGTIIAVVLLSFWFTQIIKSPKHSLNISTLYIDPVNGNDINQGNEYAPFKTLSRALKQVKSGDTLMVSPGVIQENSQLSIPQNVTVKILPMTAPVPISDIENHWAAKWIRPLVTKGIILGFPDGTFKPDAYLTRAEYATLLSKAFQLPESNLPIKFKDLKPTHWAEKNIQKANASQYLKGFPDKNFHPEDTIQKVEVIASLVSGLKLSTTQDKTKLNIYEDANSIPEWSKEAVVSASFNQLIINYPNPQKLNPTKNATRAEVTVMLYQAMVLKKEMPEIESSSLN